MEHQPEINILQDIEQDIYLERAPVGIRFANFLIDTILYYGIMLLVGAVIGLAFLNSGEDIDNSFLAREDGGSLFFQYILSFVSYLGFFTLLEGASKGKTLGKLITGTRAIKMDGGDLTWKDAFMRSLCRIVPFEAFSAFGGFPWHDKWTDTIVTKERR